MAQNRRLAIILTNGGIVKWHIYASLNLNEFTNRVPRTINLW